MKKILCIIIVLLLGTPAFAVDICQLPTTSTPLLTDIHGVDLTGCAGTQQETTAQILSLTPSFFSTYTGNLLINNSAAFNTLGGHTAIGTTANSTFMLDVGGLSRVLGLQFSSSGDQFMYDGGSGILDIRTGVSGTDYYYAFGGNGTFTVYNGGIAVGTSAFASSYGDISTSRNSAVTTGYIYLGSAGKYIGFDGTNITFNGVASIVGASGAASFASVKLPATGAQITAAATITPTTPIQHITGATSISLIAIPYSGWTGSITLIPDSTITTATGGVQSGLNYPLGLGSSGTTGKALILTFDGVKWYPSY